MTNSKVRLLSLNRLNEKSVIGLQDLSSTKLLQVHVRAITAVSQIMAIPSLVKLKMDKYPGHDSHIFCK